VATRKKPIEKRAQWIAVVTAIIRRQGKVLLGRRPEGSTLPDVWEFPGGKIEAREMPEDALRRELSEELGIDAEIGELKFAGTHTYGKTGILFLFYEVKFWKGQIKPVHHTELLWSAPKDLKNLALPDANREFLDRILTFL
jgi:8-oxo-dGTP diphosphatase